MEVIAASMESLVCAVLSWAHRLGCIYGTRESERDHYSIRVR